MTDDQTRYPFPGKEESMDLLTKDPCFGKIPSEQVAPVFNDAWAIGEEQAAAFLEKYAAVTDMPSFLEKEGFRVCVEDVDYVSGSLRYFCDYVAEKNIVTVYKKSVELWAEKNSMSYEESRDLILAHEYFHYLEWHVIGLTSKRYLVPMLKLGRFELGKTGISALSEIGANAFANRLYRESKKTAE